MTIACEPIETLPVPHGQDPQGFKEQVIANFCGDSSQVRDDFIVGHGPLVERVHVNGDSRYGAYIQIDDSRDFRPSSGDG